MRVFGFDLLPYPEHLDHLKVDGELPYPLPARHFRPELAVRNYREQDGGHLGVGRMYPFCDIDDVQAD